MIEHTPQDLHWNYFLALEEDLLRVARFIEFSEHNFSVYSLELVRLFLVASSEVDVVCRLLVQKLDIQPRRLDMTGYRTALTTHVKGLSGAQVQMKRFGLSFQPWVNWLEDKSPDWWTAHNKVKHEREAYFAYATLGNVLNAISGLFVLIVHLGKARELHELRPAPLLFSADNVACIDTYPDGRVLCFR